MESIDLGAHTVEVSEDQAVIIANESIAIELDREEAYRLLLTLQAMFTPCA